MQRDARRNSSAQEAGAPVDDASLVRAAQRDPRAFAELYDRYVDPVYRFCYRRLGTVPAAEDATSTTFFKALAALPTIDPSTGSFRAWLFTIAHNVVCDQVRNWRRRPESVLDDAADVVDREPTPEDQVIAGDDRCRLRSALAMLPGEQQHIIELRLAGLNSPEIATALGRTPGSVRTAQHRAIARLRALLGPGRETHAVPEAKEAPHD